MKTIRMKDDNNRLYFENKERISAEDELKKVLTNLRGRNVKVKKSIMGPAEDVYGCKWGQFEFNLVYTFEESFLYADDPKTIDCIERLLQENAAHIDTYEQVLLYD